MKYFYLISLIFITLFFSLSSNEFGKQTKDTTVFADSVIVISPNGNEKWEINTIKEIKWTSSDIEYVKIEYTINGDTSWNIIVSNISANLGSFYWLVPNSPSKFCRIKITNVQDSTISDSSDAYFSIGKYTEVEPNNTASQANLIEIGDSLIASINPENDVDYYKFYGNVGDTVMVLINNRNNSQLYGYASIFDKNDSLLIYSGYYYDQFKYAFIIPNTGIYFIRFSTYWGNYPNKIENGSLKSLTKMRKKKLTNPNKVNKTTSLTGDYAICLKKYIPKVPEIAGVYLFNTYYNSTYIEVDFNPNGLNTKITLEYGTTLNYGQKLTLPDTSSEIYIKWIIDKLTNLNPNETYYLRVKAENDLGSVYNEFSFSTPEEPDNWTIKSIDSLYSLFILTDISFADEKIGFITGLCYSLESGRLSNVILKTTNGCNSWEMHYSDYSFNKIFCIDSLNVIALSDYGILKTTNGGLTWPVNIQTGDYFNDLFFTDKNHGIIVGYTGKIEKTTDGGKNWKTINSNITYSLNSICFSDSNNGWIAGENGTILKTTDGGITWNSQYCGTSDWLTNICFVNSSDGFVLDGWSYYLYKTTDGGNSWDYNYNSIYFNEISFIDKNYGIGFDNYSGGDILLTTNAGQTWALQKSGTFNYFSSISKSGNNWVVIGDYGTILKSDYTIVSVKNENQVPAHFNLSQNYPNPFNPTTTIAYDLPKRCSVVLKIYNIIGEEVATLINREQNAGKYTINWNAAGLASGVYIYRLQANDSESYSGSDFTDTKKLILLK